MTERSREAQKKQSGSVGTLKKVNSEKSACGKRANLINNSTRGDRTRRRRHSQFSTQKREKKKSRSNRKKMENGKGKGRLGKTGFKGVQNKKGNERSKVSTENPEVQMQRERTNVKTASKAESARKQGHRGKRKNE